MKKEEERTEKKRNGKKSGLGLALWVLAALVLLILFLVYQDKILSNLKETDFFHRVFGKTPSFVENHEGEAKETAEKNDVEPIDINVMKNDAPKNAPASEKTGVVAQNDAAKKAEQAAAEKKSDSNKKATEEKTVQPATQKPQQTKPVVSASDMSIKLYFMEIDSDGSVNRHEVTRKMKKSNSPLVDAINALISGPTSEEEKTGCRSLIPAESKLLGATVKNGVATLNFSGEFEFNQYGVEGTLGQLQQIVYTATAFPTVESVQILVDGELKEYLGSEGVWIGTPLNRNNYK